MKTLKRITIKRLKSWRPCGSYMRDKRLLKLTGGRKSLTPLQIAALDITVEDRLWVLLRPEIIPEKRLHLLACDFAESVLPIFEAQYPYDKRPRAAIEAKRRWVAGEITDEELAAAWAAARDAGRAAAWDAASDAASDAAWNKIYIFAERLIRYSERLELNRGMV